MKKLKGIILGIGLALVLVGCAASEANQEVITVDDELVSTTDKITEDVAKKENVKVQTDEKIENSEDKESIQIEKTEVTVEETEVAQTEPVVADVSSDNLIAENGAYKDGAVTDDDFAILVRDVLVRTGDDINTLTEQLGTPDDYVQARSCLYDGDDKVYTYGGITIYTYPNGTEDIVYLIELTGEEKLLSEVGIGSLVAEVTQAYGNEFVEFGTMMAYDVSETASISFQIENDVVVFVEIYNE